MTEKKIGEVRVFCPKCKGGDNWIWKGSLIDWKIQLTRSEPPPWFHYIQNHERAHGHKIMVEYPDGEIVPWRLSE